MPGWLWGVTAAAAAVLAAIVVANLGTAEKKITRAVVRFCAVSDPAFRRTIAGLFGPQFVGGNRIVPLANGDRIFPDMLEAIAGARHSINFETFIYWSGEIGERFADALAERARSGIEVNVLLDWVGSQRMDATLLARIERSGGRIHRYHPPSWRHIVRMNNRTHRKLLIVDGRVGFTGGVGIADSWLGDADAPDRWRDTHYRVEGPVVAQMQGVFLDNWIKAAGELLIGPAYFPELAAAGSASAQIVASSPSGGAESMHLMVQLALAAARSEIAISTPYFVPDEMTVAALEQAVGRGVRVRILIAGRNIDSWLARRASQGLWDTLLAAGVEISEYVPARLHGKLLVIDRAWASVGSMNFDNRSFSLNDEANLNVLDADFAQAQLEMFEADLRNARRLTRRRWRRRPHRQRVLEAWAALFRKQV